MGTLKWYGEPVFHAWIKDQWVAFILHPETKASCHTTGKIGENVAALSTLFMWFLLLYPYAFLGFLSLVSQSRISLTLSYLLRKTRGILKLWTGSELISCVVALPNTDAVTFSSSYRCLVDTYLWSAAWKIFRCVLLKKIINIQFLHSNSYTDTFS